MAQTPHGRVSKNKIYHSSTKNRVRWEKSYYDWNITTSLDKGEFDRIVLGASSSAYQNGLSGNYYFEKLK